MRTHLPTLLLVAAAYPAAAAEVAPPAGPAAPVSASAEGGTVAAKAEPTPEGAPKKLWSATAVMEYRQLAVSDPDPANDRYILYTLGGSVEAFRGGRVSVTTGMNERFVAEPGESGVKLRDTSLALGYGTPLELGKKTLTLQHRLAVFFPTSRASMAQDLYLAPQYVLAASIETLPGLTLSFTPDVRYRWHRYAERAGYDTVMNIQWELGAHGGVDWTFLETERFGNLSIGAAAGSNWQRKYASREMYETPESDAGYWQQTYDWDLHLGYDPNAYLSVGASLSSGDPVLRDGIVNTFFVHRDETELAFSLTGKY